ncbi:MAG: ribosome small subunit-dependent GTPase A [Oscillospiraceae bacterium]|nr:ribosome small subunit-dependent GTPase A [Oscillospiraceae bacterium]
MGTGIIVKALSGFYYVQTGNEIVECRARGRFRLEGISPLVGDKVDFCLDSNGKGTVDNIHERKNSFFRPSVANIDCMVVLACAVNPITDPFLIDRVTALAENAGCEIIVCINKTDMNRGDTLYDIYKSTGYTLIRTSADTGEGIEELRKSIIGKLCAFTGNSGVGKSSILNALSPELNIKVGEVSDKLGRGKHTTRHVEIFPLGNDAYIVDTPGFSSFDMEKTEHIPKERLQYSFREFVPLIGKCRFDDCAHIKEPGCAVLDAVDNNVINKSRHDSYLKLYEIASQVKDWELK